MSEQTVHRTGQETELNDWLKRIGNLMYVIAGVLFLGGLWFDWQSPGEVIIPVLAIAEEPTANSGLFIAAVIVLVIGYTFSWSGQKYLEMNTEKVDQTQEWTVDVGE